MSEAAAIELLTRAVQLDVEQRYSDAFHCYSEGIRLLILAAKGKDKDERIIDVFH